MSTPEFYDPQKVGTMFVPDVESAITAGSAINLPVTPDNQYDAALLLIDAQVDFIHEDGALSVPGAVADTQRTIEWLFDHTGEVSHIYASLDSHLPNQIFSPAWWVDAEGNHPSPFTVITHEQVVAGEWQALYQLEWSAEYTGRLEENARKQLMIWPYHTLIGTPGHNVTPALYEALVYHSAARQTQPTFVNKGTVPEVEHYSLFEPEVTPPAAGDDVINSILLETLKSYDKIYVAGQAKSHCVLESVTSMMRYFDGYPELIRKIHVLTDTMSSVVSPGIDFEQIAVDTFNQFAEHGLQLTSTTDS